ncbi:maltokinase [Streptomyces sp. NPDC050145]|uniref:maltokinase N-terminal cap-like domain-containing protein n=1 Tax=Streptomyces sp. NPDC050145 TaxID=3365602 RepID=UPI0037A8B6B2
MTLISEELDSDELAEDLRRLLPAWLGTRRWFADKGDRAPTVEPLLVEVVAPGDPALVLAVVRTGHEERYQLLIGVRGPASPLPDESAAARIGRTANGAQLYEATVDPELTGRLLDLLAEGGGAESGGSGTVQFHRIPGAEVPQGLPGVLSTAEQSNSSIAYGSRAMLKVLRLLVPGPNPELEMLAALERAGDVPSAAPLAWIQTSPDMPGGETTLGILQEFVPNRGDGWNIAVEEARACILGECESVAPIGGFAVEAAGLGRATAQVHAALESRLARQELTGEDVDELVDLLTGRLEAAAAQVPELRPHQRALRGAYRDLGDVVRRGHPLHTQRIHGDLHLGQVLRAKDGWVLIDFEGEPGRPQAERRHLQPALRDVAAMLRSFDYAAHHALAGVLGLAPGEQSPQDVRGTRLARRASAWAVHSRRGFCAGYRAAGGTDPTGEPVLLRAFEADKAVYEALYEAHNRPGWLPIPLAAVRRLTTR